jgi:hypothetical protein
MRGSQGLENLATMQGAMEINSNSGLVSFDGLSGLTSAGWISIRNHPKLTNIDGLSALETVTGGVGIEDNTMLPQCEAFALVDQLVDFSGDVCIFDNLADSCPNSCG